MVRLAEQGFDTSVPRVRTPPKSLNGRLLDALLRHRHFLLMAENGVVRDVLVPLRAARKDILQELGKLALREAEAGLTPLQLVRRQELELFERRLAAVMARAEIQTTGLMRDGLLRVAERETEIQGAILRRLVPDAIALDLVGPDPARLEAMINQPLGGVVWQDRMRRNFGRVVPQMQRDLATSTALGEDMGAAARRIRQTANITTQRAVLIARSEIQRVANQTAQDFYRRNADIVKGMTWTAALDARTCLICGDLDGQEFPPAGPPFPPPVHPACRCFLVPVTASFEELGLDANEFPAGTRASMDGQVPAVIDYPEWFGQQSASFQRKVLGPSRFERFKAGDLKISDMVRTNRILSLDELPIAA